MKPVLVPTFAMLLAGLCAVPPAIAGKAPFYVPTKEEKTNADYGAFPEDYKAIVTAYMERVHRTPTTARYLFIAEPSQGTNWAKKKKDVIWCYNISVQINPDRSYNGYTLWTFFIRDGRVIGEYKT